MVLIIIVFFFCFSLCLKILDIMRFIVTSTGSRFESYEKDIDSLSDLISFVDSFDCSIIIHSLNTTDSSEAACLPEIEVYDWYRE